MIIHLFRVIFALCMATPTIQNVIDHTSDILPPDVNSVYGMKAITMKFNSKSEREVVSKFVGQQGFEFLQFPLNLNFATEILVTNGKFNYFTSHLNEHNINYTVEVDDMSQLIKQEFSNLKCHRFKRNVNVIDFESLIQCARYDRIEKYLQRIAKDHSDCVTLLKIGTSSEGRPLYAVKLSSGGDNKAAMLIDAGIHARERITTMTAIYAISELVKTINHALFKDIDIYIIPLLNPDGWEYTFHDVNSRLWRKTRSVSTRTRCRGVDVNRNFAFHWDPWGVLGEPCSIIYSGPYSFSEPETMALKNFILKHKNIQTYVSLHSYGNYLLYPWAYTTHLLNDLSKLKFVAKKAANAIYQIHQTEYTIGAISHILNSKYSLAGNSVDWAYGVAGIKLSFAMELPSKEYRFFAPSNKIGSVGKESFEAFKVFAQYTHTVDHKKNLTNAMQDLKFHD